MNLWKVMRFQGRVFNGSRCFNGLVSFRARIALEYDLDNIKNIKKKGLLQQSVV
jgi:hypothetical protein